MFTGFINAFTTKLFNTMFFKCPKANRFYKEKTRADLLTRIEPLPGSVKGKMSHISMKNNYLDPLQTSKSQKINSQ